MKKYFIKDILNYLGNQYKIIGDRDKYFFTKATSPEFVDEETLDWINPYNRKSHRDLAERKSKIIICDDSIEITERLIAEKCLVIVSKPKLVFMKIVTDLFLKKVNLIIHPTAVIHEEAVIAENVHIGPFTYVGKCSINEGSVIYGNCFLYDNVKIGKNVTIHAGTIIGSDGFGYERNENNELEKFPHIGGVIIEDNVEIGSNTCIDKGGLGNTIIREGSKIDNLVHIAHNVVIGKHCEIIANSMIAGSTIIGDYTWISPSASIINYVKIGDNAVVGIGAVITKNVPDGETWMGIPAMELTKLAKASNILLKK